MILSEKPSQDLPWKPLTPKKKTASTKTQHFHKSSFSNNLKKSTC